MLEIFTFQYYANEESEDVIGNEESGDVIGGLFQIQEKAEGAYLRGALI